MPAEGAAATPAPLAGHLVVDLSRLLPGPLAARQLRDLGARVIKVERPGEGDPVRAVPPFVDGESALARLLLGGLESVALDLGEPQAREVLRKLIGRADVLLETFRPGTLGGWDLDPGELRRRHPRLVVCSLSGWGESGPHAHRAGHDLTYQAVAGALASTAAPPDLPTADLLGAAAAATAILAALLERATTGEGRHIDASLLDAALFGNVTALAAEADGPQPVGEPLTLTGALPGYGVYATADGGHIALGVLEERFWRRLCEAVERPDLLDCRRRPASEGHRCVAELAAGRSREDWAALFAAHDLPAEPLLSVAEALEHPQVRHRDVVRREDGRATVAFPALFDGVRPRAAGPLPAVGADTERVLAELD